MSHYPLANRLVRMRIANAWAQFFSVYLNISIRYDTTIRPLHKSLTVSDAVNASMSRSGTAFSSLKRNERQKWLPLRAKGLPLTDDLDVWNTHASELPARKEFTKRLWAFRSNTENTLVDFADLVLTDLELTLLACALYPSITNRAFGVLYAHVLSLPLCICMMTPVPNTLPQH